MIDAGITIIDKHGRDNVALLFPIFENYLNKKASALQKFPRFLYFKNLKRCRMVDVHIYVIFFYSLLHPVIAIV